MAFDFSEILGAFTPITLTESINRIKSDEPLMLTKRLGRITHTMYDEKVAFEVEEGSYNLAPVSYSNDPPVNVNISKKRKTHTVTPPQIFLKDRITASEVLNLRTAGQNPINMTSGDKASAYNELLGYKQKGLVRLIDRRIEWMFAQGLGGKIDYTSESGRNFSIDFGFPAAESISGEYWDKATDPGNPLHHLRALMKKFKANNNQLAPDMIILGADAGDAFLNNPYIEDWMKSAGVQLFQLQANLDKPEAGALGRLQGAEILEYSSTYENDSGRATPYLDPKYVYLTHSSLWRLFYGAIADFDGGTPPIVARPMFSKLKTGEDGKTLDIYAESHPLPVPITTLAVTKAKVIN